jgi:hypothetical protein
MENKFKEFARNIEEEMKEETANPISKVREATKPQAVKVKNLVAKLKTLDQEALVVYAIDEEGNAYHKSMFLPVQGRFIDYDSYGDFVADKDLEKGDKEGIVAVCIN